MDTDKSAEPAPLVVADGASAGRTTHPEPRTLSVDPAEVDHLGTQIGPLGSVTPLHPLDPDVVTEDLIGHLGLTAAMREFVDVWNHCLTHLGGHAELLGAALAQSAHAYATTDTDTAQTLTNPNPHRTHGGIR